MPLFFRLLVVFLFLMLFACSDNITSNTVQQPLIADDYPVIDYKLERSPKINREGVGIDFIHPQDKADTAFLSSGRSFEADIIFYNVMVYYSGPTGDSISEGCPGILLSTADSTLAQAIQIGKGVDFFTQYTTIEPETIQSLKKDPVLDFEALHAGKQSIARDTLLKAYETLVIGNLFRASILEIPETSSEADEQPVFLIQTHEGAYVKFMVTQFKGDGADKLKTLVRWQVLLQNS